MTQQEVIKRLTAFGFKKEPKDTVINYPVYNPRGSSVVSESFSAMVYKLPYHDEKVAVFQHLTANWLVTVPGDKPSNGWDDNLQHFDYLEFDRKTPFKGTGTVLRAYFKCEDILDDLIIVANHSERSATTKLSQRLEYVVPNRSDLLSMTFQYIQKKLEPGIFFDYLKEKEPNLFGRF